MPAPPFSVRDVIVATLEATLRNAGRPLPESIRDEDPLTQVWQLDSLDFAVTVVELERQLGVDPFRQGGAPVRTLGDLVARYELACTRRGDAPCPDPS
ncbi:MAG TPA: hypothetical protein VIY86_14800 [Pirellulaceae bacterium]